MLKSKSRLGECMDQLMLEVGILGWPEQAAMFLSKPNFWHCLTWVQISPVWTKQLAISFHWISQPSTTIWIWEHCPSTSSRSKATKKTSNPEEEAQLNYVGRLARKMVGDPVTVMCYSIPVAPLPPWFATPWRWTLWRTSTRLDSWGSSRSSPGSWTTWRPPKYDSEGFIFRLVSKCFISDLE